MANKKITTKRSFESFANILAAILTAVAIVLFVVSYTTNYYTFGQMNSGLIALNMCGALVFAIAGAVLRKRFPEKLWPKFITYGTTALLCYSMITLLGDRVEAIGTTIVTDYDSGHGGEEAIYYSIGSILLMLVALVFNIIGSFEKRDIKGKGVGKRVLSAIIACALCLCVVGVTLNMTGVLRFGDTVGGKGGTSAASTVYKVSYNQGNGNADEEMMPGYQFLCSDFSGMVRADSRFYVDEKLTLNGDGTYALFTDAYVIESGNRAVVGDDTGLGLVLTTNAEGTYVTNADGTVTTSVPIHAVFEMQTDTYSSQMKSAAQMNVNGNDADGVYDSNDEPAVLDFVPETIWTLEDGAIVSYKKAGPQGTYTVSYNQGNGNTDEEVMPDYQFLCSDFSGMVRADSRFYVDVALTLDGAGNYTLFTDSYVVESGNRAVVGDDTGLGLVLTMNAEGTYTENDDGTITTAAPTHAVFEMQTDTYSSQMKSAAQMNVNGNDADGVYDSNDEPAVLDFVPETIWTLNGDKTIAEWASAAEDEEPVEEEAPAEEEASSVPFEGGVTIVSDDQGTTMTFFPDGTYRFDFESYSIVDEGTYTYADGVLTLVNVAGAEATADGDPLKLHYVTAVSEQLTGDYTIPASTFDFGAGDGESSAEEEVSDESAQDGVTVASDDGGTEITFNPDGSYRFFFSAYNVEDLGTYTYADGVLTLVNANGTEATAEGDPLKLHYVTAVSDQLTGDYTIPASTFDFGTDEVVGVQSATIASDDGGTELTFNSDGTYRFFFSAYNVEDAGTYTYVDGVLALVNANGTEAVAEGDPLKLHYVTAVSDQLTGDYSIPASTFDFAAGEEGDAAMNDLSDYYVIACMGDSITRGVGSSFGTDHAYEVLLEARLGDGYKVMNFGHQGTTANPNTGVAYLDTQEYQDALSVRANHYIVMLGTNDSLSDYWDAEGYESGLRTIIQAIKIANPDAVIDLMLPPYTYDGENETSGNASSEVPMRYGVELETLEKEIMPKVREIAESEGTGLYDLFSLTEGHPEWFADGVHPNDDGYQAIADYLFEALDLTDGAEAEAEPITFVSDDGGTEITFNPDGTYRFFFSAYNVEDLGTYTYVDGVLTLVNANGTDAVAEGDPMKLHYVTAVSDQLTGDYTIPASTFDFATDEAVEVQSATIASDDGDTEITFNPDGTYRFFFSAYNVEDEGTYTYVDGVLTLVNANGTDAVAEGDPMKLHYVTAVSDQLTGDYTIPASMFSFNVVTASTTQDAETGDEKEVEKTTVSSPAPVTGSVFDGPVTVPSTDGSTYMVFTEGGSYEFRFDEYNIVDEGTYLFENDVLTLTDSNGKTYTAEGEIITLNYAYSAYESLTGEFIFMASIFSEPMSVFDGPVTFSSENGTSMTFQADGTYRFAFAEYNIEDSGSYTYVDGVLTLTDANGKTYVCEGDPLKLTYAYSAYEMLTGDFTIPASTFSESAQERFVGELTVTGENRPALLEFKVDGTYIFNYEQYGLEEGGRYSYSGGILKLTNEKGEVSSAQGDPIELHYQTAISSMLVIDYTIPADAFDISTNTKSVDTQVFLSENGTDISFLPDGSYLFRFTEYNINDSGSYIYENGVLTLTDINGKEYVVEGDPLELHYSYSAYDALTGDFTIPAETFTAIY